MRGGMPPAAKGTESLWNPLLGEFALTVGVARAMRESCEREDEKRPGAFELDRDQRCCGDRAMPPQQGKGP